jgi:hypothetical protein
MTYKQIIGIALFTLAVSIERSIKLDNWWLDLLLLIPKYIIIQIWMEFAEWTK